MGVFGCGLYSGDFAMDLRSTVKAVSRLPLGADKLADIIMRVEQQAADNRMDEDHATFWLVLADQFSKRGLESSRVRDKALHIIDSGSDLAMLERLGMSSSGLVKRKRVLDELRGRLLVKTIAKSRPTLKKPQKYVMDQGDVLIYPTFGGWSLNPYWTRDKQRISSPQDGWGAMVVIGCGRAFEFLAWYLPLVMVSAISERPTIGSLRGKIQWRLCSPGTCTPVHFKRIGFERLGRHSIDDLKLRREFPNLHSGIYAAINDISIADQLMTTPAFNVRFLAKRSELQENGVVRYPAIRGLDRILSNT